MNDLQKAIDNLTRNVVKSVKTGSLFSEDEIRKGFQLELKPLLEQVAKEQRGLCSVNWSKPTSGTIEDARLILEAPLVTENLTFNED